MRHARQDEGCFGDKEKGSDPITNNDMYLELRTLSTEMYFMLVMMLNEHAFEIDRNSLEGLGAEVWRKLVCGSTNWAWVPGNVQF